MRWRYCCPKGHHNMDYRSYGRYCRQCEQSYEHTEIIDKMAGGVA